MASRTLNRRKLREQADQAEQSAGAAPDAAPAAAPAVKKARKAAAPKKPRAKKAPPRMRARWGVFDGAMKQVAIFDYNERTAADAKMADLREKKKGSFFLQIVKEPMPEPEPVAVPAEV